MTWWWRYWSGKLQSTDTLIWCDCYIYMTSLDGLWWTLRAWTAVYSKNCDDVFQQFSWNMNYVIQLCIMRKYLWLISHEFLPMHICFPTNFILPFAKLFDTFYVIFLVSLISVRNPTSSWGVLEQSLVFYFYCCLFLAAVDWRCLKVQWSAPQLSSSVKMMKTIW